MKSIRFILVLAALLSPLAGAQAQVGGVSTPPPATAPAPAERLAHEDVAPLPADRLPFAHQGVLVERLDGEVVREVAADQTYNPASAIKLATALVALRSFGPQHRFKTTIWVTGTFDQATGTVTGDIVVSGRDPAFHDQHAVAVARELNRLGIRTVSGDLIVAPKFSLNYNASSQRSGERFYDALDATRRPAAAARAWADSRVALGDAEALRETPSVAVMGAVYVGAAPSGARVVSMHQSPPLVDILKALLCYSNNFLAERIGDAVGGPAAIERYLSTELKIPAGEFRFATASGLGVNRLTPRHMMRVYRALLGVLHEHDLKAADILPVAGIDPGTLQRRYENSPGRGSVIAKTGTLNRTDGGASALVGQMKTKSGETLLFVVFNMRGSVPRFRAQQDAFVAFIQGERGGPLAFTYQPRGFAMRLAASAFDSRQTANAEDGGEYESQN
ncbi:MAG TPA: D-alanyl-D-alanine carboxypeptidase [Pyrinomonadaceae bacterium]|nr:D-alanyl-D-alanine carboxypeptidase [Pyrinomonadaceae bacterium]